MEIKSVILKMKMHIKNLAHDNQEQDDLLQDAMVKVLKSKPYLSVFETGFLYRIARSTVLDEYRYSQRQCRRVVSSDEYAGFVCEDIELETEENNVFYHPTYFDPYHEVGQEELDEIPQILASLSFEHREVLVFYANGLTCQEIAHMIGLKEGTVKSRLHYARRHAHKLIEQKRKEENAMN